MSTPVITPIPPYDPGLYPLPQVTPFTFRDGATFLERFERLCYYINNTVLPTINSQVNDLSEEFINEVNALIQSVNDSITADQALVDQKVADLTTYVNDQVATIIGSSVSVQDPVMQGIINNVASLSRLALDALYAPLATFNTDHDTINTGRLSASGVTGSSNAFMLARAGIVYMADYPRQGAETDDAPALQRAINDAITKGAKIVRFGAGAYQLGSVAVNVAGWDYGTIDGAGITATRITVVGDVNVINVTSNYVTIQNLMLDNQTVSRVNFTVLFNGVNLGSIKSCYFNSISSGNHSGVSFVNGSMGNVQDSTFNHSCIRVQTWDVKISRCYMWAMTCDYGIGVYGGAGNLTVDNVDIVPPLKTNATGLAAIWVDGTGASSNLEFSNVYLDGNPSLSCKEGIIINNSTFGVNIIGCKANQMDSDCIVIDGAYMVNIIGYEGQANNSQGLGSREIVVRKTGAQSVEAINIIGAQCVRTTAVSSNPAPAIFVDTTVGAGQVNIRDFSIKQPGAGGGYSVPEVSVPKDANGFPTMSMSGKAQMNVYSAVSSQAFGSGVSSVTLNLGGPTFAMAYRPTPAQIELSSDTAALPTRVISYNSDNQVLVTFSSPTAAAGNIHWRAHLTR